ncbi:MAG: LCP family protein [Clostridia bacterium]|nr:LCP family protein [Clostridia bacterium]
MKYWLRNFALTFLISLVIFGSIAWVVVGGLKDMSEDILTGEVIDNIDSPKNNTDLPNNSEKNELEFKGKSFNFLAVALDKMPLSEKELEKWRNNPENEGLDEPYTLIEALMLVRADKENKKFIFISLPTDFIINFKGENMPLGNLSKKLNLNEKTQLDILCNEVTSLTGLSIDYYSVVDMTQFVDAIDRLGGFQFIVPQDMKYSDPEQNLNIDFKKGQKITKGEDFLKMLRFVTYNHSEGTENNLFNLSKAKSETARNALHMEFVNMLFQKMLTADNMISVAIWIPELLRSSITNFTLDVVKDNIDLIFSYENYITENVTYSQNYINYINTKYSDSEPNKENIKVAIAKISSLLNK